jgi:transforming growth factor-beta-induced protein
MRRLPLALATALSLSPTALAQQPATVVDALVADGNFTTLVTAVQTAGLDGALSGPGPFTVFAPDDAAFAALPPGALSGLLADPAALADVLLFHVVGEELQSPAVVAGGMAASLLGPSLEFGLGANGPFVEDALISSVDLLAGNGVVHTLSSVLTPPDSIGTGIGKANGFSVLTSALQQSGLDVVLDGDGPFTLFAPTDAAFAKIPAADLQALLADPVALANVLQYHVIGGSVLSDAVLAGGEATMLQGDKITLTGVNANKLYVNGAFIQGKDFEAKNGIVHVIDEVLLPGQPNVIEYLDLFESYSTLRTALEAASLTSTLEGPGPFTLFAPTDRAFAKLPAGTVPGLLADIPALTDVLTYHVIAGEFLAVDVAGLTSAMTLQGADVNFSGNRGMFMVNSSLIQVFDVQVSNGVIHVIDEVLLLPPS